MMNKAIGKLHRNRALFFCCDIQDRFRNLIHNFPSVLYVASMMNQASSLMNIPFIATEQYVKAFGKTCPEVNLPNPPKEDYYLFEKKKFSMLTEDVKKVLEKYPQRDQIVLFGIEAHVCVLQTALDLLEANKEVHVLADGTSSQRSFDRSVAFERMRQSGAFITSCESALFQMMEGADYEKFKEVSALMNPKLSQLRPHPGEFNQ
ncbi:hypothetical protein FDP41_003517 [Naegleria fowleri]|uniref:Isochorismatase-like domain-containing protein n=1 Tax=Naegleria fowleri TaxID=5763 RepID=A0A6A5BW03_NAEFO|nr:uncharacterized protein FDP41_003517 [Naegleria fowleri]KAF0977525.1 hypothetical protein FDP41_003517 [Naegleria fowleri]